MINKPTVASSKSLSQKLGLKNGMKVLLINAPKDYYIWVTLKRHHLDFTSAPPWNFVHLFVNTTRELENILAILRDQIVVDGMIWVSWYKKSAKKQTELTEDIIRDTCLPLGYVDVKVCAVTDEWSGLKLVIRKELR